MKQRYDIVLTVELSQKQLQKLQDAEDLAEYSDEYMPLWLVGKTATRFLREQYGVKARLVKWIFRRSDWSPWEPCPKCGDRRTEELRG